MQKQKLKKKISVDLEKAGGKKVKYIQDTKEKSIFAKIYNELEAPPLSWCEKRTIDTDEARKKTKELIKKCKTILSLLDKVEGGKEQKQYANKFFNKKNRNIYNYLGEVIDCTNKRGNEVLCVLYEREGILFVREKNEFFEKFEKVEE